MKDLDNFLQEIRDKEQTLVLATGVFDVLHQEHAGFLEKAKELADFLIVGIESDKRVKELKGESRPINSQDLRKSNLEKLNLTDFVFILPEDFSKREDHEALISQIKPDYFAVSASSPFMEVKKQIVEKFGGELKVVLAHNPEFSSSKIIDSWQRAKN